MKVNRNWLYLGALVLLAPALLINLGLHTFIDDEAIRSLVALEMKLSGNYVTPTLHGEYYYNKPPLYNWWLLLFFSLSGAFDEWTARIPTVLATIGFAATIYYYVRKHYDRKTAFLNAFFYITCGRVLFWDSMLALIDTTFSWVVFTMFMVVYHEFEKERWGRLFVIAYFLAAVGFLLKGLPSLVFLAVTLLAYFVYRRRFRRLFSWPHVAGGLVFVGMVGGYYLLYHQYNALDTVFAKLVSESSKRTVVNYGVGRTILHFFTFPLEMVYHFLPWSLMILYVLRRKVVGLILADRFITFNVVTFLANIIIYWTSPEVYPRYLLMLAPLIFSVFIYLHQVNSQEKSRSFRWLDRLFLTAATAVAVLSFTPLFLPITQWHDLLVVKTLIVALPLLVLTFWYYRNREERLLTLVLILLIFRIGFDIFVLPDRNRNDFGAVCRESSKRVGRAFAGKELYLYRDIYMQPTNSFYLTNEKGAIIPRKTKDFTTDAYYIIYPDTTQTKLPPYEKVDGFWVRHGQLFYDVGMLRTDVRSR